MVDNINSLPLNVQDNTDVVIEDNVKSLSSKATENEVINLFQRDILVFDKDETLIHIISADDYNDDVYKRQINKEWSFSFTADVSLSDVIIRKNKIGVYDREGRLQLFIVEDITERYSKTPTMEVYCIHDSFILNDTVLEEFTVTDTIDNVLDSVLAGTSYQRGYTDQFDVADIDMQLTSRFGGLQTIAETFGGELDFRFTLDETRTRILNRYVDVKFSLGRDIGVRFTFDTNLTEVVRTVTSDNHFTVLYGLGRSLATGETKPDGSKEYKRVDFSEVAWGESTGNPTNKPVGQRYIEDTEGIKKWGRIEGIYINETITDPKTLINRTWKQLQKCKEPSFSYSVTVEDLSKLAGYEHLSVGIGDTVIIKDEDFKLELSARIQEEQYSIKENIIKALDAESVPMPMSARAITGLSSHGGGNKKLVLGVLQRDFTGDNSGSGTVSPPTVDTGSGDVNVDNENFPDVLPATPIISGTGLFATIMTSWTFENSIYYGYELHGSQVENFITNQNTILARGKISSHLHQCKPGERWYFKVRAYNTHGNYTPFSNEIALESAKVADGTEWFENAAIGDALIGQLRLDRGWVGQLHGNWIDARQLSVTNGNGKRTLDIDSFGNVNLDVNELKISSKGINDYTKELSLEVANTQINNLQIGGANLLLNSDEKKELNRAEPNTYNHISYNLVDDYKNLTLSEDTTFVLSFTADRNGNFDKECFDSITFDDGWYQRWSREDIDKITYIKDSTFKFVMKPKTLPKGTSLADKLTFIAEFEYGGALFYNVMLVEGDKAFDYSPSFTDINNSIAKMEIKADEIASTVAKQEVSNMKFGVENLLLGTTDFTPSTVWHNTNSTWHNETFRGCKVYYVTIDWAGMKYYIKDLINRHILQAGITYTISCYARASATGISGGFYSDGFGFYKIGELSTNWTQYSYTFTPTQEQINSITDSAKIRFEPYSLSGSGKRVYVACYKLERGNKATDYTKSSEEIPTTAEMNSAIIQKANEITSTVELTKKVGVELLPQSLKINSTSGFFAIQGSLKCDYWGLFTGERSWWRSEAIQVDTSQPFYYRFEYECNEGYSPQIYIGLEQWRTPSESMGENDRTVYVVAGTKTTGWQCAEGTLDPSNFESDTRYIRLRVLVNWDNSPMARFTIFNMSLKQLRDMNSSTQIAQMSDKIESKVDVNGVKSTISQSASEVLIAFNNAGDWNGTSGNPGRILFNANGIHSKAPDGSYSTLGKGQMTHYIAGSFRKYHSLMLQGWLGDITGTQWSRTVQLPQEFRGKVFSVMVAVNACVAVNTHDVIKHYRITVPHETVNYANGTFVINMSALAYWVPGQGSATAITTDVSWLAIA